MTSTKTLCKRDFTLKYGARKKDFHIRPYADAALADVTGKRTTRQHAETVTQFLGEKAFKEVIRRLTRKAFFIEPAISTVNTTHYAHRWYEGSHFYEFNRGDPRWCDYKSCKEIFAELLQSLATDLADPVNRETLNDFLKHNLDPYELPIGYVDDTTSTVPWIHRPGNLEWIWAGPSKETIAFRTALEEIDCEYPVSLPAGATQPSVSNVPLKEIMSGILKKKIKTKTHLTDRVQVGEHQTDREKRWECHPDSVHYSSLEEAWRIEHRLLTQLVNFQDFPQEVRSRLAASGLIVGSTHTEACPITGRCSAL